MRMIRLIRIVKLYKVYVSQRAEREARRAAIQREMEKELLREGRRNRPGRQVQMDVDEDELLGQSRVGKKLSDQTTRKVIMLVLALLFVLPYLEAPTVDSPFWQPYAMNLVQRSFMNLYEAEQQQTKEKDAAAKEANTELRANYENQALRCRGARDIP